MSLIDKIIIAPLGFATLVYIFTSIKVELNRLHIHNILYDILLVSFFLALTGIFLFIRFAVSPL